MVKGVTTSDMLDIKPEEAAAPVKRRKKTPEVNLTVCACCEKKLTAWVSDGTYRFCSDLCLKEFHGLNPND